MEQNPPQFRSKVCIVLGWYFFGRLCSLLSLTSRQPLGLLEFDPVNRLTIEGALAHPYLANLHDPEDEVPLSLPLL